MVDQASGLFEAAPSTRRGGMAEVIFPWRCGLVVMGNAVAPNKILSFQLRILYRVTIYGPVRKLDCS